MKLLNADTICPELNLWHKNQGTKNAVALKYQAPNFIEDSSVFNKWLDSKVDSHFKRDKKRFGDSFKYSRQQYKQAVYEAVLACDGKDFYTMEVLNWSGLNGLGKNGNYNKKEFANLPTLEHFERDGQNLDFVIVGWSGKWC